MSFDLHTHKINTDVEIKQKKNNKKKQTNKKTPNPAIAWNLFTFKDPVKCNILGENCYSFMGVASTSAALLVWAHATVVLIRMRYMVVGAKGLWCPSLGVWEPGVMLTAFHALFNAQKNPRGHTTFILFIDSYQLGLELG